MGLAMSDTPLPPSPIGEGVIAAGLSLTTVASELVMSSTGFFIQKKFQTAKIQSFLVLHKFYTF